MGDVITGTDLYLTKRGNDGITTSFVAMRTNLLPLIKPYAEGGVESIVSKSFSL